MEIERAYNKVTNQMEIWSYDWDLSAHPARKINRKILGIENDVILKNQNKIVEKEAVCWSYGRTLGNIAVSDEKVLGSFPGEEGEDAILDCDIVAAGKMRNGNDRWWCRTHQKHWGTKADIQSSAILGDFCCANHDQPMSYVVNPFQIKIQEHCEVGVWCSLPAALSNLISIKPRRPKIHVHIRNEINGKKIIDRDYNAVSIINSSTLDLFQNVEIEKIHITPPAAFEFLTSLLNGSVLGCINCRDCGYPHLDLGEFAQKAHRKHLCGNCGKDNTWSSVEMASTPLKPLYDLFPYASKFIASTKTLDLDEYTDYKFQVWASTPAILWTADRPQDSGIHVHVYKDGAYLIDDTYGTVIYKGEQLSCYHLREKMIKNTLI